MKESRTFFIQNFGCRATQADGAALSGELAARGLLAAEARAEADVVVVNTCTVTAEADSDARQTIRRIHRENPEAEILVTGCYAQRRPEDLATLPGVKWVVGNSHKPVIGEVVSPGETVGLVQIGGAPIGLDYHGEISAGGTLISEIYDQRRFLSAPVFEAGQDRSRPNLKIQDGCNNRCSFCVIPSVRGYSRSAPGESVVEQVRALAVGYPEVVLTGINLGRWGRDLAGRPRFTSLLRRLLAETDVSLLRLSSVEPMDWTAELLEMVAGEPRIANHVHIPLQSGCDRTLKAMRRRYRSRHYASRLEIARAAMPFAAIGADVMVGFPGETEADFEESRAFVEAMPFTYLHVFTFSAREGTAAAEMAGQVPKVVKKERNRVLRELAAGKNLAFREKLVGRRFRAVSLEDGASALTENYLTVRLEGAGVEARSLVEVEIVGAGGVAGPALGRAA